MDTMVARKTIVALVGCLLIRWVVWITVNLIESFGSMPWPLLLDMNI